MGPRQCVKPKVFLLNNAAVDTKKLFVGVDDPQLNIKLWQPVLEKLTVNKLHRSFQACIELIVPLYLQSRWFLCAKVTAITETFQSVNS